MVEVKRESDRSEVCEGTNRKKDVKCYQQLCPTSVLWEKEKFWNDLDGVIERIPRGERVVLGADFMIMVMLGKGTEVMRK